MWELTVLASAGQRSNDTNRFIIPEYKLVAQFWVFEANDGLYQILQVSLKEELVRENPGKTR